MEHIGQSLGHGAIARRVPPAAEPLAGYAQCRVCELEEENARLRLLVGELLVANQKLREQRVRGHEPAA